MPAWPHWTFHYGLHPKPEPKHDRKWQHPTCSLCWALGVQDLPAMLPCTHPLWTADWPCPSLGRTKQPWPRLLPVPTTWWCQVLGRVRHACSSWAPDCDHTGTSGGTVANSPHPHPCGQKQAHAFTWPTLSVLCWPWRDAGQAWTWCQWLNVHSS